MVGENPDLSHRLWLLHQDQGFSTYEDLEAEALS